MPTGGEGLYHSSSPALEVAENLLHRPGVVLRRRSTVHCLPRSERASERERGIRELRYEHIKLNREELHTDRARSEVKREKKNKRKGREAPFYLFIYLGKKSRSIDPIGGQGKIMNAGPKVSEWNVTLGKLRPELFKLSNKKNKL